MSIVVVLLLSVLHPTLYNIFKKNRYINDACDTFDTFLMLKKKSTLKLNNFWEKQKKGTKYLIDIIIFSIVTIYQLILVNCHCNEKRIYARKMMNDLLLASYLGSDRGVRDHCMVEGPSLLATDRRPRRIGVSGTLREQFGVIHIIHVTPREPCGAFQLQFLFGSRGYRYRDPVWAMNDFNTAILSPIIV